MRSVVGGVVNVHAIGMINMGVNHEAWDGKVLLAQGLLAVGRE